MRMGGIASNPVSAVRKPPAGRSRAVTPLSPETVEGMRDWLLRRGLVRDPTLLSVLAYAGLRPGEALALTWAHVRGRTILVEARSRSARSLRRRRRAGEPCAYCRSSRTT
jgi:integrase